MNQGRSNDIRPLTDEERGWVDQNWATNSDHGFTRDADALTRAYQLARGGWEMVPAEERTPAEHTVIRLGALAGQYICNFTDFEWGVRGEGSSGQWVLVNPVGDIIEPMQRVAEIWSGSLDTSLGGFVEDVVARYSGER